MESKNLDDLRPDPRNPRTMSDHDANALKASMDKFGDISCVVFNRSTNQLVGGHQRIEMMKRIPLERRIEITEELEKPDEVGSVAFGYIHLGKKKFAYREVDWPLEQERDPETDALLTNPDGSPKMYCPMQVAANIAANRIQGEFNLDILAELNYELSINSPDMLTLTGQTPQEISMLLDMTGKVEGTLTEDDEAPEVEENADPISVAGAIYQLGKHRLMCGDATSRDQVSQLLEGKKADMVFTDPPYNIGYEGGGGNKREGIMNDKMSTSKFSKFLEATCTNLMEHCKGAMYICMSSAELDNLKQAFEGSGGHFQNFLIWVKNTFTLSGSDYQHQYEPILYGWPKEVTGHYYVGARDKSNVWEDFHEAGAKFDGEYTVLNFGGYEVRVLGQAVGEVVRKKSNTDILRFDKPTKSEDHPTMKPIALCEEAIRNSSMREGTVLDLFGGSGSTLIAADRIGRTCFMMELDPKYCDVIRKRYAEHAGKPDWESATPRAN